MDVGPRLLGNPNERLLALESLGYIRLALWGAALLASLFNSRAVYAGVGPENVIVVVNADSQDSRTIANHYSQLRKVPTRNVILLRNIPMEPVTSLEKFREQILKPLLAEVDARGLAAQTKAIAYSAGFPYAVNIAPHHARIEDANRKKMFTPVASLNGLTFFYRFILADREDYLNISANFYARMPWDRHFVNPFNGEDGESFDAAKSRMNEAQYSAAGKLYADLLEKFPSQAPLGVLAAEAYLQAGQTETALTLLERAIQSGWNNGGHFRDNARYDSLRDNPKFNELIAPLEKIVRQTQGPIGFESTRGWSPNGWWVSPDQGGVTYLPSFLLATVGGEGTTVDEAVAYLERAVEADHTFPTGTVYFTITGDVRTTTRSGSFPEALLLLKELGGDGRIERAALPKSQNDCMGVTVGTARFDWAASGSQFLPGALADNLTSTGGVMHRSGQTKLTEFLKAGAAAASGTVTEPFALQFKFPLPQLHGFYLQGASAIEAFYSAVASPYQLLMVGDPLCQPYAQIPAEIMSGRLLTGNEAAARNGRGNTDPLLLLQTRLQNSASADALSDKGDSASGKKNNVKNSSLSSIEFYLDGKLAQRLTPQPNYEIKLAGLAGGSYEFRTVLIGEPNLAPQKSIQVWIDLKGLFPAPQVAIVADPSPQPSQDARTGAGGETALPQGRSVQLQLDAVGADSIRLNCWGEEVVMLSGDSGRVTIDLTKLGNGPVRLRPVASFRGTEIPGKEIVIER
jgi:uncharacterized protein (TIGR03790 family)